MLRLVVLAGLLASCRVSLESNDDSITGRNCPVSTTSSVCIEAATGQKADLDWIEQNIFGLTCSGSGCHNGDTSTRPGQIDLRPHHSHDSLVNIASKLDTTRKLVVPGDVEASYLMLMLHDFAPEMASPPGQKPPDSVGYMPQNSPPLCCQKLDALERWIRAGAPAN
jgi:hypothetical protein